MNMQKMLSVSGLATVTVLSAPAIAQAVTFSPLGNFDTQYEDDRAAGIIDQLAVTESRIGDRGGNATFEQAILTGPNNSPAAQANFDWQDGVSYDFSVTLNGGSLTYVVGGQALPSVPLSFSVGSPVNALYLRTRSDAGDVASLSSLVFNGSPIAGSFDSNGSTDWWSLTGFSGDFTLTGQLVFDWDATLPRNSQLSTQIKVTNTDTTIPTPALLPGLVGMAVAAVRKKANQSANA